MQLIKRLLVEAGVEKTNLPQDMEGAVQMCASLLNSASSPPLIVFIDALNQVYISLFLVPKSNFD